MATTVPPPQRSTAPASAQAAIGAAAAPTVSTATGAGVLPSLAAAVGEVASAAAIAALVRKITAAIGRFSSARYDTDVLFITNEVAQQNPDEPVSEIHALAMQEERFEKIFREKMRLRLLEDLPKALSITDLDMRLEATQSIIDRELRYVGQRQEAMYNRVLGRVEALTVKRVSPQGAYWALSPHVAQHTLDCLAMGEKFWPWTVLKQMQPPLHAGCPCRLYPLDDAVAQGLMTADQVPDQEDAEARFRQIKKKLDGLEEALVEVAPDGADVSPEQVLEEATRAREGHKVARWAKGFVKGGEFRAARDASPRVKVPEALAKRKRGRWSWIGGVYTRVPEKDRWVRKINGRTYTSPAGSTNVWRDGLIVAGPGIPVSQEMRQQPLRGPGASDSQTAEEVSRVRDARRDTALRTVRDRLAKANPPVDVGEGADVLFATREAGFRVTGAAPVPGGHRLLMERGGQRLTVTYDGRAVTDVSWMPDGAVSEGKELGRPPESFDEFAKDVIAWAHEAGARFGADVAVPQVTANMSLADHAGLHHWNGDTDLGRDVPEDIDRAGKARRMDRDLSESELRGVYASYWSAAHEAIGHGVNPIDPVTYQTPDGKNFEEALADETAHLMAVERLTEQGQLDVVGWRARNTQSLPVLGSYRAERHALANLFDAAGVTAESDRRRLLFELKFQTPPEQRADVLGALVAANRGVSRDEATDLVRQGMSDVTVNPFTGGPYDDIGRVDGRPLPYGAYRPVLRFNDSPGLAQVGRLGYGRMAVGALSPEGDVLSMPNGARRRVERLPIIDGAEGLTDGSALASYGPGQEFTDGLLYADGSPKSFRYTDDSSRGRLVLRAFSGKGMPPLDQVDPAEAAYWQNVLENTKGLVYVRSVPVKQRFDGTYGVGFPNRDGRNLSGVWDAEAAAKLALLREQQGMTVFGVRTKASPGTAVRQGWDTLEGVATAAGGLRAADGTSERTTAQASDALASAVMDAESEAIGWPPEQRDEFLRYAYAAQIDALPEPPMNPQSGMITASLLQSGDRFIGPYSLEWTVLNEEDPETGGLLARISGTTVTAPLKDAVGSFKNKVRLLDEGIGVEPPEAAAEPEAKPAPKQKLPEVVGNIKSGTIIVNTGNGHRYKVNQTKTQTRITVLDGEKSGKFAYMDTSKYTPPGWEFAPDQPEQKQLPAPKAKATKKPKYRTFYDAPEGSYVTDEQWGRVKILEKGTSKNGKKKQVRIERDDGTKSWHGADLTIMHPGEGGYGGNYSLFGDDWSSMDPTKWIKDKLGIGKKSKGPVFIGGKKRRAKQGPIPYYDNEKLRLGNGAGGSNGAVWAIDGNEDRWLLKTYKGNEDRVATELLANAVYRVMGARVADAGTIDIGGKIALTYKALDGKTKSSVFKGWSSTSKGPSDVLGKHYMVDALTANWDFVGMTDDNIMWDPQDQPFRVDQGGTFEFRAKGDKKPFGPVPTEVWTMIRKGQAARASLVDEDGMREQAAEIAKTLTPAVVDSLVNAAPFADKEMRERVRENLKARIAWMSEFSGGGVDLPRPLSGDAARDHLAELNGGFELFPEQEAALVQFMTEADHRKEITAHFRGKSSSLYNAPKGVKHTSEQLDSLLRKVEKTKDDMYIFERIVITPSEDEEKAGGEEAGKGLVGKTLSEASYSQGSLDEDYARDGAAVMRVLVPEGTSVLYTQALGYDDIPEEPEVILSRDASFKVDRWYKKDGKTYLDVVAKAPAPFKSYSSNTYSSKTYGGKDSKPWSMNSGIPKGRKTLFTVSSAALADSRAAKHNEAEKITHMMDALVENDWDVLDDDTFARLVITQKSIAKAIRDFAYFAVFEGADGQSATPEGAYAMVEAFVKETMNKPSDLIIREATTVALASALLDIGLSADDVVSGRPLDSALPPFADDEEEQDQGEFDPVTENYGLEDLLDDAGELAEAEAIADAVFASKGSAGTSTAGTYVVVYAPDHPQADRDGYVLLPTGGSE